MPRPKSFDQDAVLDQAVELFRARGYEATALADLEAHLGLRAADPAAALLASGDGGLGAIRSYFRAQIAQLTGETPRYGCLVVNTIAERQDDPDSLLRCIRSREALERAFRQALQRAKARGELPAGQDIEGTATLLATHNYGLVVLAKTGATAGELTAAVEALPTGLG